MSELNKEREAFKAWFKKDYLGIDNLANQGDEGAITRRDYAYVGWQAAKAQAVPESRTDFEIIEQTLDLVDLIAHANRFQRDKIKPLPFESENPRNIEWWRLACQIQELLTDTDPNNCDFEEYKAMIEAQEPAND